MPEFEKPKHRFPIEEEANTSVIDTEDMYDILETWVKVNDENIETSIIDRESWNAKRIRSKVVDISAEGQKTLYIPLDLKLWELLDIIESVEVDTKKSVNVPVSVYKSPERIKKLAKIFQNSAVYLAQRLELLNEDEGKDIAEAMALDFYNYSQKIISKRNLNAATINDILKKKLSPEDIEAVENFLAGDNFYSELKKSLDDYISKKKKKLGVEVLENEPQIREKFKNLALKQFFKKAKKHFEEEQIQEQATGEEQKDSYLQKIRESIRRNIRIPEQEFYTSFFRRGIEKIFKELRYVSKEDYEKRQDIRRQLTTKVEGSENIDESINNLLSEWDKFDQSITSYIQIDSLKTELQEVRKTGNIEEIVKKENEIIKIVAGVVSSFKYELDSYLPEFILQFKTINCVGASIVGSRLLEQVGVKYLGVTLHQHSIIAAITSDMKTMLVDMTPGNHRMANNFEVLEDQNVTVRNSDGKILSVSSIPRLTDLQENQTLDVILENSPLFDEYSHMKNNRRYISLYPAAYGLQLQAIQNFAEYYLKKKPQEIDKAILLYQKALEINPNERFVNMNLALMYSKSGRYEEAESLYFKILDFDPQDPNPYLALSKIYEDLKDSDKSLEIILKGIKNCPKNTNLINHAANIYLKLQKYSEVEAYLQKCIDLEPKNSQFLISLVFLYYKILGNKNKSKEILQKIKESDPNTFMHLEQLKETREIIDDLFS